MRFTTLAAASCFALGHVVQAAHGDGYEGTVMGPVAFLWPDDRKWDENDDNIGPCGSAEGVINRTDFPLDSGSVALSIADDAYKIAFYIAFNNYPTSQVQFQEQVVNNVSEVDPGHQCYMIDPVPDDVVAGTNATIQLQYWASYGDENDGNNQTFYACADITFVENEDFKTTVPCFNVSAEDFETPSTTTTTSLSSAATGSATSTGTTAGSSTGGSSSGGSSLSTGAKAGIAVGSVIGGLAIIALPAFFFFRRRRASYLTSRQRRPIEDPIPLAKRNIDAASNASVN